MLEALTPGTEYTRPGDEGLNTPSRLPTIHLSKSNDQPPPAIRPNPPEGSAIPPLQPPAKTGVTATDHPAAGHLLPGEGRGIITRKLRLSTPVSRIVQIAKT